MNKIQGNYCVSKGTKESLHCTGEAQPRKGQPALTLPTLPFPMINPFGRTKSSLWSVPPLLKLSLGTSAHLGALGWSHRSNVLPSVVFWPPRPKLAHGGAPTLPLLRAALPSPTAFTSPPLPGQGRQDSLQSHQVFPVFSFSLSQL